MIVKTGLDNIEKVEVTASKILNLKEYSNSENENNIHPPTVLKRYSIVEGNELAEFVSPEHLWFKEPGKVKISINNNEFVEFDVIDINNDETAVLSHIIENKRVVKSNQLTKENAYMLAFSSKTPIRESEITIIDAWRGISWYENDEKNNYKFIPKNMGSHLLVYQANGDLYAKKIEVLPIPSLDVTATKILSEVGLVRPVGSVLNPKLSYLTTTNGTDVVKPAEPKWFTYKINGEEYSIDEVNEFMSDSLNTGTHRIEITYPLNPQVSSAFFELRLIDVAEWVNAYGIEAAKYPSLIHNIIPTSYSTISNEVDITNSIEYVILPEQAAKVESSVLTIVDPQVDSIEVTTKLGDLVLHKQTVMVNSDMLSLADPFYGFTSIASLQSSSYITLGGNEFVRDNKFSMNLFTPNGDVITPTKDFISECEISISNPSVFGINGNNLYVASDDTHYNVDVEINCSNVEGINVSRSVRSGYLSNLSINDLNVFPSLAMPTANGRYSYVYNRFGDTVGKIDINNFIQIYNKNNIFNSKNEISGSESVIVTDYDGVYLLPSFVSSTLTLLSEDHNYTYDIDVTVNTIDQSAITTYDKNRTFTNTPNAITLSKNLSVEDLRGDVHHLSIDDNHYYGDVISFDYKSVNDANVSVNVNKHVLLRPKAENSNFTISGNSLIVNDDLSTLGMYEYEIVNKDNFSRLGDLNVNIVDSMRFKYVNGPYFGDGVVFTKGSTGKLRFLKTDGSVYEIEIPALTQELSQWQILTPMISAVFTQSGGHILPIKGANNQKVGITFSSYLTGFAISNELTNELREPIAYDFRQTDAEGNIIYRYENIGNVMPE